MFKVGDRVRAIGDPRWVGVISELMFGDNPESAAVNWRSIDGDKRDFDFSKLKDLELLPEGNDILKGML